MPWKRVTSSPSRPHDGLAPAGRLRREGLVPAVVYGHGGDRSRSPSTRELRTA